MNKKIQWFSMLILIIGILSILVIVLVIYDTHTLESDIKNLDSLSPSIQYHEAKQLVDLYGSKKIKVYLDDHQIDTDSEYAICVAVYHKTSWSDVFRPYVETAAENGYQLAIAAIKQSSSASRGSKTLSHDGEEPDSSFENE